MAKGAPHNGLQPVVKARLKSYSLYDLRQEDSFTDE